MAKRCRNEVGPSNEDNNSAQRTMFVDTNLDTHLAIAVSDSDTFSLLKKKLMIEHLQCFPELGELKIHALKVKRKGKFYHLSDSLLVKSAFEGNSKSWFLSVDASSLKQCGETLEFHEPNVTNQLPLHCLTDKPLGAEHNNLIDNASTSAVRESSLVELARTKCADQKVHLCQSDCHVEISNDIGTEVKHITAEHVRKVACDSYRMPDVNIQEKCYVTSKVIRSSDTAVEHDETNATNAVTCGQLSNSLEPCPETTSVAIEKHNTTQHKKDKVGDHSSKANIASTHASDEVASIPEIVGITNSLTNAGQNKENGLKIGSNDSEEAIPSGPAKKRRKAESHEASRNPLQEREIRFPDSEKCTSRPEIHIPRKFTEDEHSSQIITSSGLFTEPPSNDQFGTNSGIGRNKKRGQKRKMHAAHNLSSNIEHIGTVLPSVQDAGVEGSCKETGELHPKDLIVKPPEVESLLVDGVRPGTLSQASKIHQKGKHGELVQKMVEGTDICKQDMGNVDKRNNQSDIGVISSLKGAKRSKKQYIAHGNVNPSIQVAEVHVLNTTITRSVNENDVGDHKINVNDLINIEEESKFSLKQDSELLLSEKRKSPCGSDVNIEGPVSSADIVNAKAVMESGKLREGKREKKRAKKTAEVLCQNETDESEKKVTNASSSIYDDREGNSKSENEAENLAQTQTKKELSHKSRRRSSEYLQPTYTNQSQKSSENIESMSSEEMIKIKESTAKVLQNSLSGKEANAGVALNLDKVEKVHKPDKYKDKRKKSQNSAAKNFQDSPYKEIEVGGTELATSNDRVEDMDNKSKGTKKIRSHEPSAASVDLHSSMEHVAKIGATKKSSGGIDPEESFSMNVSSEFLLSSKKSSEASENRSKSPLSHDSSQVKTPQPHCRPIVAGAGNRKPTSAYGKGNKVSSAASSSSSGSPERSRRDRRNNNLVAGRKVSAKNIREAINSSLQVKSLLTTPGSIFREDGSESSASEDESDASTHTPSVSSPSVGLDEESDSSLESPRNGSKGKGTKGGQNIDTKHSSQLKNVSMDTIFRSSNRFKKAKLIAEAQPEDSESQPIDYVPDSQAFHYP